MISSVFFFCPQRPINFIIIPQISGDGTRDPCWQGWTGVGQFLKTGPRDREGIAALCKLTLVVVGCDSIVAIIRKQDQVCPAARLPRAKRMLPGFVVDL